MQFTKGIFISIALSFIGITIAAVLTYMEIVATHRFAEAGLLMSNFVNDKFWYWIVLIPRYAFSFILPLTIQWLNGHIKDKKQYHNFVKASTFVALSALPILNMYDGLHDLVWTMGYPNFPILGQWFNV